MSEARRTGPAQPSIAQAAEGPPFLDPKRVRFFRHGDRLRLTIDADRSCLNAKVFRAFPLSDPDHYYSVRDGEGKDLGMIRDPSGLRAEDRRQVEEELTQRYFAPAIVRVVKIIERFGTVEWDVATDRGRTRFTTRNLRENRIRPSHGRYILTSVDGNRFDVRDIHALDRQSREWLLRHL